MSQATQGKLKEPAVLEKQVRRMLQDRRSSELVNNFAGQWLYLRNLQSVNPAMEEFPDYDENLRQAFRRETEMLFAASFREPNVIDLLTRITRSSTSAAHYDCGRYGSQFRRVSLSR
jgi:hypothetical protein